MKIQKGEIRNPEGRGARKPLSDAMRALLYRPEEELDDSRGSRRTVAQAIAAKIVQSAYAGDKDHQKMVLERIEGKPIQEIKNPDDEMFRIQIMPSVKVSGEVVRTGFEED